MAVTVSLSPDFNLNLIYRYDNTLGTYTSLSNSGATDLFDDSFEAGDILYFGHTSTHYSVAPMALYFDIDTAMAGTSYELAWEYYDYYDADWKTLDTLVDETNNLTTTGYVRWRPTSGFYFTAVNGITRAWVRCRIVSASGASEGGHIQSPFKFKYSVINITGGTQSVPANMEDIYTDTDVSDWGLVEKYNMGAARSIYIAHVVQIRNTLSTDYFSDKWLTLIMPFGYTQTGHWQFGKYGVSKDRGATLLWGCCRNDPNIRPAAEEYLLYDVNLTSTYFGSPALYSTDITMYGCSTTNILMRGGDNVTLTNSNIQHWENYTGPADSVWSIDNCIIGGLLAYQNTAGFIVSNADLTIAYLRWGNTIIFYDTNYTTISIWSSPVSGGNPGYFYSHSSLNLTVQDVDGNVISGASVAIVDTDGNTPQYWSGDLATGGLVDYSTQTTDVNGQMSTDLLYYYYKRVFDPAIVDTIKTYGPFTITVSKTGYQTKVIELEMDEKATQVVVLEKQVDSIIAKGILAVNADPANSQSDVFV